MDDNCLTLRDLREAIAAMGQRAFDSTPTNILAVKFTPVGQGRVELAVDDDCPVGPGEPKRD
jgi:hypothetical protein